MPIKNNNETFTKKFNRRKYNNYSLKKVPFVKDLKQFLYQFHSNTNHKGFEAFRKALINDNIYYKGIIKDIQNIIDNCAICKLKNQKINLKKDEKFNLILFKKPKDRYIGDLTSIPIEFKNNVNNTYYDINKNYNYIFTIIDHFSKFSESYLLKDKKQNTILNFLKNFFDFYGEPIEFGTDNGRELINLICKSYFN